MPPSVAELSEIKDVATGAIAAQKMCTTCHVSKDLIDFHATKMSADGRRSACKACRLAAESRRRATFGDRIRAQQRDRYQRTREAQCEKQRGYRRQNRVALREYFRAYRQRRPDVIRAGQRRWNAANPEKRRAHSALWNAIRRGIITIPEHCATCGQHGHVEAHHHDYQQPLAVQWLCELCHVQADLARQAGEA